MMVLRTKNQHFAHGDFGGEMIHLRGYNAGKTEPCEDDRCNRPTVLAVLQRIAAILPEQLVRPVLWYTGNIPKPGCDDDLEICSQHIVPLKMPTGTTYHFAYD